MNKYEKQANDFLKNANVKMIVKFLKHDKHFQDDTVTRDIFKVTFKRQGKQFSLKFGQSINESDGIGTHKPSAHDVLSCLTRYEPESFEYFCSDFGYDDFKLLEYPKVKKIYNSVCKEWKQVKSFFSDDEIEKLQDIN